MDQLYITRQATVQLQHKDGVSVSYRYGDPVDPANLSEAQLKHLDRFVGTSPSVRNERALFEEELDRNSVSSNASLRAALAEAGQPNSTSSPVPGNYGELDEAEAIRFIRTLDTNVGSQAVVLAHELRNAGRPGVLAVARPEVLTIASSLVAADGGIGPDVETPPIDNVAEAEAADVPPPTTQKKSKPEPVTPPADDVPPPSDASTTDADDDVVEIPEHIQELTGKDLKERAAELGIDSSLKADEKRQAIAEAEATSQSD